METPAERDLNGFIPRLYGWKNIFLKRIDQPTKEFEAFCILD
jgi:hypothetical protein